jgi:CRISPR/Cas system-associated exonuclease Cas4 (RecB family)
MTKRPVIEHYLDLKRFERAKRDLRPLVGLINRSGGEYSLQLRKNYFNIYYQGNSLAKVILNKNGTYSTEIHKQFLRDNILKKLEQYSKKTTSESSDYVCFRIEPKKFYQFFQSKNLKSLSARIRAVGNGEEITFEQALITDNPPSKTFIIIDRQVADHKNKAQMDLLALRRDSEDKPFYFVVIEVKLGRNPELHEKVGNQLSGYVDHIKEYMQDYVTCYKENYRQKKELGLFDSSLPDEIEIDEDEKTVAGLIVVGSYSQLAKQALGNLCQKIKKNRWDINVQQMRNEIKLDNRSYCEEP